MFNFSIFFRGKALQVFVGGLRVALRPLRRVDTSLSEAHRVQALQVQLLWPLFFPLGPLGAAHEATPVTTNTPSLVQRLLLSFYTDAFLYEHFLYELFCAPWGSAILPLFLFVRRTHCGKRLHVVWMTGTTCTSLIERFQNRCLFPFLDSQSSVFHKEKENIPMLFL